MIKVATTLGYVPCLRKTLIVLARNQPSSKPGALSQSPTSRRARPGRATTASALAAAPASLCLCHGSDSRVDPVAVTAGDHRTVCSPQPAAADRRPRIRGVAPPRRTNLAPPATPISLCCFSPVAESCPTTMSDPATVGRGVRVVRPEGCRRTREKSLRAASLRMLAEEPDVDPARVPEATGAPIRGHRRRDGNRLDGVGDQPSPSR